MSRSREIAAEAIAYLKVILPPEPLPGERLVALSPDDTPVIRELGNGLGVGYLIDEGSTYGYVQHRDLASSQLSESDLHKIGIENLSRVADERLRVQPYDTIFALLMGGTFEASMILLDDLWDHSLTEYVGDDVMVVIPARDVLAFGDASSPDVIRGLQAVIDRLVVAGTAELATVPYRRRGGQWFAYDA